MSTPERVSTIQGRAVSAQFFLDALESNVLGRPVAQLRNVRILNEADSRQDLDQFFDWCAKNQIALCSCRLPQTHRNEAILLEDAGFRWIELNYRPECNNLRELEIRKGLVNVEEADENDRVELTEMAGKAFDYGRFHQDPRLGSSIGNRRYRRWMDGAFQAAHQRVLKCVIDDQIIGFVVIEQPEKDEIFWSLMALGRDCRGKGLGRKTWEAILLHHQRQGARRVVTSISSHNVDVLNLYVRLGWRFPNPLLTFHWCPNDLSAMPEC